MIFSFILSWLFCKLFLFQYWINSYLNNNYCNYCIILWNFILCVFLLNQKMYIFSSQNLYIYFTNYCIYIYISNYIYWIDYCNIYVGCSVICLFKNITYGQKFVECFLFFYIKNIAVIFFCFFCVINNSLNFVIILFMIWM